MTLTIPVILFLIMQNFLYILAAKALVSVVLVTVKGESSLMLVIFGLNAARRLFWTLLAAVVIASVSYQTGASVLVQMGVAAVAAVIGTIIPLVRGPK